MHRNICNTCIACTIITLFSFLDKHVWKCTKFVFTCAAKLRLETESHWKEHGPGLIKLNGDWVGLNRIGHGLDGSEDFLLVVLGLLIPEEGSHGMHFSTG